jgi:hypothetical protein
LTRELIMNFNNSIAVRHFKLTNDDFFKVFKQECEGCTAAVQ